jgi:hypothetical protein
MKEPLLFNKGLETDNARDEGEGAWKDNGEEKW